MLPTSEDEPGANVFFNARSFGGRFRLDSRQRDRNRANYSFTRGTSARAVRSSTSSTRATEANQDSISRPRRAVDPATCGWKFIATVSTIPSAAKTADSTA